MGARRHPRRRRRAASVPGWRAQPCPADGAVRAAMQRIHVSREHRGACHLAAVRLCGLSTRTAMVINLGVEQATHYGRQEPHPVAAALIPRRQRAEQLTDELHPDPWNRCR
ncbi:hypothetical protein ACIBCU_16055 [Streptomyces sp. NPDC051064]|uniref:helix-turn-helix domain-containing protein n=1 Tax=Streptomyces sp. NPDC051064 TaxID=3365641 RepID=UPI0037B7F785